MSVTISRSTHNVGAVNPGYNDIVLCDTFTIPTDILWYQLIAHG